MNRRAVAAGGGGGGGGGPAASSSAAAAPSITPSIISRSIKRHRQLRQRQQRSSHVGLVCAALAAVLAFGGTFLLAMAVISSHINGADDSAGTAADAAVVVRGKAGALRHQRRQRSIARNKGDEGSSGGSIDDKENEERSSGNVANNINNNNIINDPSNARGVILHTYRGDIRIHFTPELSGPSSIKYVADIFRSASSRQNGGTGAHMGSAETANGRRITEGYMCQKCKFYRAEKKLLLQGSLAEPRSVSSSDVKLGPCPEKGENYKPKLDCPKHDPNCGCHGPIMTRGMVGWAGGANGPDFFINTFEKPVDWWDHQHTVWGEIRDERSLGVVEGTYDLPATESGMRMLNEDIEFSLELF